MSNGGAFGYHTLMRHRVEDILLVASPYDSFVLEEDGQFSDRVFRQYLSLNLTRTPRFHQVSTLKEARMAVRTGRFDLVITTPHGSDVPPPRLAAALKEIAPELPVVLLSYDRHTARYYVDQLPDSPLDHVFLWGGSPRLLLAMIKLVEDQLNVARDTRKGGVRVIVLVEDSPEFYSSYLPVLYAEVFEQTVSLMPEVLHIGDRMYRMRARPRVLLARTYEEARALLLKYRNYLIGVVMDLRFRRKGRQDPHAGKSSIKLIRKHLPDLPVLLQSAEPERAAEIAEELGVSFADKNRKGLLRDLRRFMSDHLGFGPFVFRLPNGAEVDRATDVRDMLRALRTVPAASLSFHGARHHISNWLMARTEFALAGELHARSVTDFDDPEQARRFLVERFTRFLEQRQRGQVTDWVRGSDPLRRDFSRIGGGSMGGKARGIAFLSQQLADHAIHERFPEVKVLVPRATVLCTEVFDAYVEQHAIDERAAHCTDDAAVARLFLSAELDDELLTDLSAILEDVRYPLAVRSSSLYEDSAFEPLAGAYQTRVVPNCSTSARVRLSQLSRAIRLVWASTYFQGPRRTMAADRLRAEEEKMAVVVQRLVGRRHGDRFYPDFAGVGQSHNFYPTRYLKPSDGIVAACLGLGQTVVDGDKCYRFCPKHPKIPLQFSNVDEALRTTQRQFYALDLSTPDLLLGPDSPPLVRRYELSDAEADGTLAPVGATFVARDDRIVDTIYQPGARLVNFAQVLKYDRFPLASLLSELLALGEDGLGTAAEMEFAVALDGAHGKAEFAALQLRPLSGRPVTAEAVGLDQGGGTVLLEGPAMGSGVVSGLADVVYVHPDRFESRDTRVIAAAISHINAVLQRDDRPYILIGPGRWGTADPALGIPVSWPQVAGARAIAELAIPGFRIEPSQGTHFFHNLTSLRIAYFTVDLVRGEGRVALDLLEGLEALHEIGAVRHVRLPAPARAWVDGDTAKGCVTIAQ